MNEFFIWLTTGDHHQNRVMKKLFVDVKDFAKFIPNKIRCLSKLKTSADLKYSDKMRKKRVLLKWD